MRLVNNVPVIEIDNGSDYTACSGVTPLNDGQPHLVTIKRSGTSSGNLSLFIDCNPTPDATCTSTTSISSGLGPLHIGSGDPCIGFDGTVPLNGTMTDVCVGTL